MAITSVDIDPELLRRARELSGAQSNRAVISLALRRMIAFQQKGAMLEGILKLTDLPASLVEIGAIAPELAVPPTTSADD